MIIVITLPLIPLFMILIGLMTRDRTERKLATMSRLSAQLLDLVTGLPTLRALNRARAPARQVADLGQAHRRSSMSSLRVAFLSGGSWSSSRPSVWRWSPSVSACVWCRAR